MSLPYPLRTTVLSVIAQHEPVYGTYAISREVEKLASHELTLTIGRLYPLLHHLERRGLISQS